MSTVEELEDRITAALAALNGAPIPLGQDRVRYAAAILRGEGPARADVIRHGAALLAKAGQLGADVAQDIAESAAERFGLTSPSGTSP